METPDDLTLQSAGPAPTDGVHGLTERLEATIQTLAEKDMEVIKAYTLRPTP